MSAFSIVCDVCHLVVEVDPPEDTDGYRLANCRNCNSDLSYASVEVRVREVTEALHEG